jgi:hypothetical protein
VTEPADLLTTSWPFSIEIVCTIGWPNGAVVSNSFPSCHWPTVSTVARTCQQQQLQVLVYLTAAMAAHCRHQAVASLLRTPHTH